MKIIARKKLNIRTKYGVFSIELQSWEGDRGYVVHVLSLPEIVTQGDSIDEAKKMAREAIELSVECEENEHHTNIKSKRSPGVTVKTGV